MFPSTVATLPCHTIMRIMFLFSIIIIIIVRFRFLLLFKLNNRFLLLLSRIMFL
jgi:hypothetical protein